MCWRTLGSGCSPAYTLVEGLSSLDHLGRGKQIEINSGNRSPLLEAIKLIRAVNPESFFVIIIFELFFATFFSDEPSPRRVPEVCSSHPVLSNISAKPSEPSDGRRSFPICLPSWVMPAGISIL